MREAVEGFPFFTIRVCIHCFVYEPESDFGPG
jgi:hypothetical protein